MLVFIVFAFVIGAITGSFLGAFTYRYPLGISISKGRSFCPKCKSMIHAYDNIPLLSFILLRGKCRSCKTKISFREPLIELMTGLAFSLFVYWNELCGSSVVTGSYCAWKTALPSPFPFVFLIVIAFLISIFVIDLEHQIIPDSLIFVPLALVVLLLVFWRMDLFYENLFAGFVAGLFLLVLHLITLGKGMGLGDVKFAILGGVILGVPLTMYWMFSSFIIGAVIGVALILFGKTSFGKHIPFGPFLIIALLLTFIFGDTIGKFLSFVYF